MSPILPKIARKGVVQIPWTTPLTAVSSTALTAAQWNSSVRDNLLETPAAKATAANGYFVGTGPNAIAERFVVYDYVGTTELTSSTSYTNLTTTGPEATVTTGTAAMVWTNAQLSNSTSGASTVASFEVSGASTIAASDNWAIIFDAPAGNSMRASTVSLVGVTAGSNTFRMMYRVSAGGGSFTRRRLVVLPL